MARTKQISRAIFGVPTEVVTGPTCRLGGKYNLPKAEEYVHPMASTFCNSNPASGSFTDRQVFRLLNITVYKDRMPPKIFTDGALAFMKTVNFYQLDAGSETKLNECLHLLLIATKICEKQGILGSSGVRADIQRLLINLSRRDFEYRQFFTSVEKMLASAEERMTAAEKQLVAQV